MIILWSLYVILLGWNRMFASSSVLTLLNDDGNLRVLKKPPNDFEYVLKRHSGVVNAPEEPDSKERRSSNMGSSFIRFGRGQSTNNLDSSASFLTGNTPDESAVNRRPRWKNPDIVIRFGRSGWKSLSAEKVFKRGRDDRNFIRFGRNNNEIQVLPAYLDLSTACSEVMSSDLSNIQTNVGTSTRDFRPYISMLLHLCELTNNDGPRNTNELVFLNDNRVDAKRE